MDAFQAIVLRIVQGLAEWEDPGSAFTAVVQLGTMAAVLLFFRGDLWRILTTWLRSLRDPELRGDLDARMGWYIGLGTVPIAILGFIFRDQIESGGRNLYLIGSALIVLGLVLLYAEHVARRVRPLEEMGRNSVSPWTRPRTMASKMLTVAAGYRGSIGPRRGTRSATSITNENAISTLPIRYRLRAPDSIWSLKISPKIATGIVPRMMNQPRLASRLRLR